VIII